MKVLVTRAIAIALILSSPLAGCAASPDPVARPSVDDLSQTPSDEAGPGSVISVEPMADVDRSVADLNATAVRVTYRSTSGITGLPTAVTGALFVPAGRPAKGGWPVLAFAHAPTGIDRECAPSRSPDLLQSIRLVATYLQLGFAVAAPDYEGLGGPGAHPFLDAKTGGLNLIDSVRALRAVSRDVGDRWGALGVSQGGAVSWAANEQSTSYAPELHLVGAVSLAPLADVSGYVDKAVNRTLTKGQEALYIWALMGLERTRPNFNVDAFRHGLAKRNWSDLSRCAEPVDAERRTALLAVQPGDLVPSAPSDVRRLSAILKTMALPQHRAAAPMLVMYGGADTYVDAAWTRLSIERACAMGSRIAAVYQANRGHTDLNPGEYAGWLMSRFQGMPAPSTC